MDLISKVISDMWEDKIPQDYNDPQFVYKVFKSTPCLFARFHESTPEMAINECLFEYSTLGKQLKEMMDKLDTNER